MAYRIISASQHHPTAVRVFSVAEWQRFGQWLAADPLHRRICEQVERAWKGLPGPPAELSAARKKTGRWRLLHRPLLLAVGLGIKEGRPLGNVR